VGDVIAAGEAAPQAMADGDTSAITHTAVSRIMRPLSCITNLSKGSCGCQQCRLLESRRKIACLD
jgi:hypothetical protein